MYKMIDQDYESFGLEMKNNGNMVIYSLDDDVKVMELSKNDMSYLHAILEKYLNIG